MTDASASDHAAPPSPRWRLATAASLLTVAALVGPVLFAFLVVMPLGSTSGQMQRLPLALQFGIGLPAVIVPFALGGAVWGVGLGWLVGGRRRAMALAGAVTVAGTIFLLEIPVHLSQALPPSLVKAFPLRVHGVFTLVFTLEVAVIAGVATRFVAARAGDRRSGVTAVLTAIAAAAGFVSGSLLALALDFAVSPGRGMDMVWALFVAATVSAAAGGWLLGWRLARLRRARRSGSVRSAPQA